MPGRMCPLKKHRNMTNLPLALKPMKSKDVLAVLAERNQAVVPVGVWVEPASPNSSEITAYTSACIIEEELKEQLRRKEEALKHFQRQVKHRVNQQIRLRKKQQLQKSYEAAEKEGSVAMQPFDLSHLTPQRTSVFPSNLNAAFGSSRLPPSQMLGDAVEDGENQSELFQQQAQALSQTMKLARHRLASFKTVSEKMAEVFPHDKRKTSPIQEKAKFKNPLFVVMEENEQENLQGLQNILPESQGDLMEVQSVGPETQSVEPDTQAAEPESQTIEPEGQAIKTETQGIMLKTCSIKLEDGNIELEAQDFLPQNQAFLPKDQHILPKDNCVFPEGQNTLHKCQDQNILHKDQDFLPRNQHVCSKEQDILLKCQDEDFLPEDQDFLRGDQCVLPKDQNILPKCQDQDFLPEDQSFLPRDQCVLPQNQNILPKCQDQDFLPGDQCVLPQNENILPKCQDQDFLVKDQEFLSKDHSVIPNCQGQDFLPRDQSVLPKDQNTLGKCQQQDFPSKDQGNYFCQPTSALTAERWEKEWPTSTRQHLSPRFQGQPSTRDQLEPKEEGDEQEKANLKQPASILIVRQGEEELPLDVHQDLFRHHQASTRDKKVHFKKDPLSDMIEEKGREDFFLADYQCLPPKPQYQNYIREQNGFLNQTSSFMTEERIREELLLEYHQYVPSKIQDESSSREQSLYVMQKASTGTAERQREDLLVDDRQHLAPRDQRGPFSRQQVYKYQSGLSAKFQASLAIHSGIDQEEEKKERQKQYLRHRRLFMDIEREQVKGQKRQKEEQKKKIEKIKKKQQRYVEEQRIVRLSSRGAPYSEQEMSDSLGQLQLEEIKGAREKQQQREKEYVRYVEALRAQVQEKMKLYNITLPPLCFCGPDFWDAHPDTCANNCIFYKNHRAYHRALYSVISSSDVSEGNSTLRNAIHNFASAHRRILKNM
ncbi:coiled-coil domain-containing protein 15 [Erethizon dorsatum]